MNEPLRKAIEAALVEGLDDLAAHSAYADLLQESGDPAEQARGEFVRVQLALEDEALPDEERLKLKGREGELLAQYERDWLGDFYADVVSQRGVPVWRREALGQTNHAIWARGWLHEVYLIGVEHEAARALAECPGARLLRRLHFDEHSAGAPALAPLRTAPFLDCLRAFQFGPTADYEQEVHRSESSALGIVGLIARLPRLEEVALFAQEIDTARLFALPNLERLRSLIVYHADDYPLEVLAANPALVNLTTIRFHPRHSFEVAGLKRAGVLALLASPHLKALTHLHLHASDLGDEGCRAIVESGILARLKVLDLRFGCIQDEGARLLVRAPDVRRLEQLRLDYNELSAECAEELAGLGLPITCGSPYEPGSGMYLSSGDYE